MGLVLSVHLLWKYPQTYPEVGLTHLLGDSTSRPVDSEDYPSSIQCDNLARDELKHAEVCPRFYAKATWLSIQWFYHP